MRQATIYYKDLLAGTLTETDEGQIIYEYGELYMGTPFP